MDDNPFCRTKLIAGWTMAIILVVPILYVLSIGPVWAIDRWNHTQSSPPWIGIVYWPLIWLANESDFAYQWLEWYLRLWGVE
jgi:hypothetical protein